MPEPVAARGDGTGGASGKVTAGRERPSLQRRLAIWALVALVSYGLTLSLLSDSLFPLAIPGLIGLVIVVAVVVQGVMHKPFGGAGVPFRTDGTDPGGAVKHHRAVVGKRCAAVASVGVVLAALGAALVTTTPYVSPLMGVGLATFVMGTVMCLDQMRWIRQCARVLDVYGFEFRAPVQPLTLRGGGRRQLRVGGEGSDVPKMSARATVGHHEWPGGIAEGVWFAGDDAFGGAVLVPTTGELMCVQPLDWGAFAAERSRAGAERTDKARRAGLDKRSM